MKNRFQRIGVVAALLAGWSGGSLSAQTLEVTPSDSLVVTFSGFEGGSLSPTTGTSWTLDNADPDPLEFSVSSDQPWLILTPSGGTLPGSRRTIDVVATVDEQQTSSLAPGIYTATVTFTNLTTSAPSEQRTVSLQIAPAGLSVVPAFLNVSSVRDGSEPADAIITLTANGGVDLNYSVIWTLEPWLSVSKFRGTVGGGGTDTFAISFNTFGLVEGTYTSTVTIENTTNGFGSRDLPVTLIVGASQPGTVSITPDSDMSVHGPAGGIPQGSQLYILQNTSSEPVQWKATSDATWVTVSPASGILGTTVATGEQGVTVRPNAAVNDLPAGVHSGVVMFTQLVIQPLTSVVTEVPLDSRVVRITADPVLDVSVPQDGGSVAVEPGTALVVASSQQSLVRSFAEVVTLTAIPNDGFDFSGWTADFEIEEPLDNTLVVTMDSSRSASAVFTPILRTLTLGSSGTGTGTIVPSPTGLLIDNGLVARYNNNENVTLTASPDAGSVFLGWAGNVDSGSEGDNPLVVTMDRDRTISARFEEGVALTVSITGDGNVSIDPDLAFYEPGAQVTLTALPGASSSFLEWTGDASGDNTTLELTLDESVSIEAVFTLSAEGGSGSSSDRPGETTPVDNPNTSRLQVEIDGDGIVTPSGGQFAKGAKVTLIATPGVGAAFVKWEGDATGTELVTNVVMESDRSVRAVFSSPTQPPNNLCPVLLQLLNSVEPWE